MTPVDQDKFSSHEDQTQLGNCFSAAIASLLDLPLEEVPFFRAMPENDWFTSFWKFLIVKGYEFIGSVYIDRYPTIEDAFKEAERRANGGVDGYFLTSGTSPRGFKDGHAVIYKAGKLVHDPHPDRTGLVEPQVIWMIQRNP